MDDRIIKLLFFALIVLGSVVKSVTDKKRKEELKRRGGNAPARPRAEQAAGPKGKSLAEWIEEIRRESEGGAKKAAQPAPEDAAEDVVVHHQRHTAQQPSARTPYQSIKSIEESKHVFQEAAQPSILFDEDEAKSPTEAETPKEPRKAQEARVAVRYQSEHADHDLEAETLAELDPKAPKARRARKARRAVREGEEARGARVVQTGIGALGLTAGDLRRAFIMKELFDLPLALREEGPKG